MNSLVTLFKFDCEARFVVIICVFVTCVPTLKQRVPLRALVMGCSFTSLITARLDKHTITVAVNDDKGILHNGDTVHLMVTEKQYLRYSPDSS